MKENSEGIIQAFMSKMKVTPLRGVVSLFERGSYKARCRSLSSPRKNENEEAVLRNTQVRSINGCRFCRVAATVDVGTCSRFLVVGLLL